MSVTYQEYLARTAKYGPAEFREELHQLRQDLDSIYNHALEEQRRGVRKGGAFTADEERDLDQIHKLEEWAKERLRSTERSRGREASENRAGAIRAGDAVAVSERDVRPTPTWSGGRPDQGTVRAHQSEVDEFNARQEAAMRLGITPSTSTKRDAHGWLGEYRALNHSSGLGAGITPPQIAGQVFDRISEAAVVIASGVPVIPTDHAELWIPRITADQAAVWVPELTEITPSHPGGDRMLIRPKKLAALTHVSNEVWNDAETIGLRAAEGAMVRSLALGTDKAMLVGSGTGEEPAGMTTLAGTSVVAAVGMLVNLDPFAEALALLASENARGRAIYVNPRTWGELLLLKRSATGAESNMPLIADPVAGTAAAGSIYGVPVYLSPFLPKDGGDDDEATALVVDTDHLAVVRRTDVRLEVDSSALFTKDGVALRATVRLDLAVPFPKAITKITGILPPL